MNYNRKAIQLVLNACTFIVDRALKNQYFTQLSWKWEKTPNSSQIRLEIEKKEEKTEIPLESAEYCVRRELIDNEREKNSKHETMSNYQKIV